METSTEYKNTDFYLSCCILAAGLSLKRLEPGSTGTHFIFVFDDPQNRAEQIIADHWNRKLLLSSRDLIESINELKTRIHQGI